MQHELEDRESDRREARDALRKSERAISDANRALQALEAQARALRASSAELEARRGAQERALQGGEAALTRLALARGGGGAGGVTAQVPDFVRLALSGEDLADTARRLHYYAYLSRAAAQAIGAQRAGLAELARLRREGELQVRELAAVEGRARADRERLLAQRREHRRLVERIAGEIRRARRTIQVLVADESRLARLVEEIGKVLAARPGAGYARVDRVPESGSGDGIPFSRLKGRLRLPVRGDLLERFGAPRLTGGAGGTPSKGVFIRAAEGEPVRAVAAGRVVYSDWMRGFGNLLIVDHGENFLTIYGNNESLLKQTGDSVNSGEPLATVGASGGNEETGLYFELRHLGKPFDPLRWVKLR